MLGALNIWNACIIPSLLSNCSTWLGISVNTVKRLDDLQHLMVRTLLRLPSFTPLPALRGALGLMGMKWRVWQEKVLLVVAIMGLGEDTLARQVLEEQVAQGYPGLAKEVSHICMEIGLPNVCIGGVSKREVKAAIASHHLKVLKEEMEGKVKCAELVKCDLSKPQPYFASKCLSKASMGFRVPTRMVVCPGNMRGKFLGKMECMDCVAWREEGELEVTATQSHLTVCPAYSALS